MHSVTARQAPLPAWSGGAGIRRLALAGAELAEQFGGGLVGHAEPGAERVAGDRLAVLALVLGGSPPRGGKERLVPAVPGLLRGIVYRGRPSRRGRLAVPGGGGAGTAGGAALDHRDRDQERGRRDGGHDPTPGRRLGLGQVLAAGQERDWMARVMVKPSAVIASRPTSRLSPWATAWATRAALTSNPHLGAFFPGCESRPTLIMMGASNLWFPSTQSIIVMPRTDAEKKEVLADHLRVELGIDQITQFGSQIPVIRALAAARNIDVAGLSDADIAAAVAEVLAPPESDEAREERRANWDPTELLIPEWRYLQKPALFPEQKNNTGLMVTEMQRSNELDPRIVRVVGVNRMKRVNAVLGFTRLDEMDRVNDVASRLVDLTRNGKPTWVPATEDRGEGIFLQFDLDAVAKWERKIETTPLWDAHRGTHQRNFARRFSETAKIVDPDTRLPGPRYWLVHTLSHILIREMAMYSGYGAASLTERIYAWDEAPQRDAAAGLLICTTASDSEGTLGGLVALSAPTRLQDIVLSALRRAARCSSDPVCAMRTPSDPEDFLHGAACHTCCFVSETSCEKANRFLDRRFLLDLPFSNGPTVPGFFGSIHGI